jgi:hypothetical protein
LLVVLSLSACGGGDSTSTNDDRRDELELFLGHYADCRTSHNDVAIREQMVAAGTIGDDKRVVQLAPRAAETALALRLCIRAATSATGVVGALRDRIARPLLDIALGYSVAGDGFKAHEPERTRLISRSEALQHRAARELGRAVAATLAKYIEVGGVNDAVVKRVRAA